MQPIIPRERWEIFAGGVDHPEVWWRLIEAGICGQGAKPGRFIG